jgi:hypothetical protein
MYVNDINLMLRVIFCVCFPACGYEVSESGKFSCGGRYRQAYSLGGRVVCLQVAVRCRTSYSTFVYNIGCVCYRAGDRLIFLNSMENSNVIFSTI